MKQKLKYILPLVLIIGLALLVYSIWLRPAKALNFVIPNLNSLSHVKAKIQNDTAYIDVVGVLENKAPYKIRIDSLSFELKMEGETFIKEEQSLDIEQVSGAKDSIDLTFRLPFKKIKSIMSGLRSDEKDSTYITADFQITYHTFLGKVNVPVHINVDIKTPNPPKFKLNNVKYDGINLREGQIDLALDVKLINENEKLEVDISDLKYDAIIGEHITGSGSYSEIISIKPGETINLELPINVDYEKPFQVIWKIITNNDKLDYEFNVDATLNNESMEPIPVSVKAVGNAELINRKRN